MNNTVKDAVAFLIEEIHYATTDIEYQNESLRSLIKDAEDPARRDEIPLAYFTGPAEEVKEICTEIIHRANLLEIAAKHLLEEKGEERDGTENCDQR